MKNEDDFAELGEKVNGAIDLICDCMALNKISLVVGMLSMLTLAETTRKKIDMPQEVFDEVFEYVKKQVEGN